MHHMRYWHGKRASWILISTVFANFLNQTLIDRKKCFCFESYFRKKFLKHFANVYDDAERDASFLLSTHFPQTPSQHFDNPVALVATSRSPFLPEVVTTQNEPFLFMEFLK